MATLEAPQTGTTSADRTWVETDVTVKDDIEDVVVSFLTLADDAVSLRVNGVLMGTRSGASGTVLTFDPFDLNVSASPHVFRFEFASPRSFGSCNLGTVSLRGVSIYGYRHSAGSGAGSFIPAMSMSYVDLGEATSWAPFSEGKIVSAYVVDGTLDGWFKQPFWPVAETPLSQWLMAEVGYEKPEPDFVEVARPREGQGWPVWGSSSVEVVVSARSGQLRVDADVTELVFPERFVITSVAFQGVGRLRLYRSEEGARLDAGRSFSTAYTANYGLLYDFSAVGDTVDLESPALGALAPDGGVVWARFQGSGSAVVSWFEV